MWLLFLLVVAADGFTAWLFLRGADDLNLRGAFLHMAADALVSAAAAAVLGQPSEALMLLCNALFVLGTWKMHELQVSNVSPVVGLSMIWVYGIGYVVGTVMGLFNLRVMWRILSGRITENELVQVKEDAQ